MHIRAAFANPQLRSVARYALVAYLAATAYRTGLDSVACSLNGHEPLRLRDIINVAPAFLVIEPFEFIHQLFSVWRTDDELQLKLPVELLLVLTSAAFGALPQAVRLWSRRRRVYLGAPFVLCIASYVLATYLGPAISTAYCLDF